MNKIHVSTTDSPCVRNCCLNENDVCLGCFRTITEITQWTVVDDQLRQVYLENAKDRKIKYKNKLKS